MRRRKPNQLVGHVGGLAGLLRQLRDRSLWPLPPPLELRPAESDDLIRRVVTDDELRALIWEPDEPARDERNAKPVAVGGRQVKRG